MPKIVNHDQRRAEIVAAVWRVIAREGIANATTRQIANEAGYSNGTLAHYFPSKADLLASALLMAHRQVRERTDKRIGARRGLEALRILMIEALPITSHGLLEAKIEVSFWGEAIGAPSLRNLQNKEVDAFRSRIRDRLLEAQDDLELDGNTDIDRLAHECLVLVDGLSIQAVMYPSRTTNPEQLALLDALLERIAPAPLAHPNFSSNWTGSGQTGVPSSSHRPSDAGPLANGREIPPSCSTLAGPAGAKTDTTPSASRNSRSRPTLLGDNRAV